MINGEIHELIARWETLDWLDRKRIIWISFWSNRLTDPKLIVTGLLFCSVLGILLKEHHTTHRIQLLSVVFLFYFYAIAMHFFYKVYFRRETS